MMLTDIFERPLDGEDDPRIQVARCITRAEAEAILEYRGDLKALSNSPAESGLSDLAAKPTTSALATDEPNLPNPPSGREKL